MKKEKRNKKSKQYSWKAEMCDLLLYISGKVSYIDEQPTV